MSKEFRQITQSSTEPSINNIWLKNGRLYYFNGGWKEIGDVVKFYNPEGGDVTDAQAGRTSTARRACTSTKNSRKGKYSSERVNDIHRVEGRGREGAHA